MSTHRLHVELGVCSIMMEGYHALLLLSKAQRLTQMGVRGNNLGDGESNAPLVTWPSLVGILECHQGNAHDSRLNAPSGPLSSGMMWHHEAVHFHPQTKLMKVLRRKVALEIH